MKPPPHIETVGTPGTISGFDYDWTFDGIGNRKKQSVSSTKVGHVATNLNPYSKTFNDTHGDGKQDGGEPRRLAGAETDHASHGPQGARAVRRRGRQSDLSNPIHDADGNMEQDANYDYTYDAEPERSGDRLPSFLNHRSQNRLIQRTPRNPSGNKMRLNFAYDYRGRRVEIISDYHTGSAWAVFYKETMLYDGWNPVMHYSYNDLYHGQTWVNRAYTWGLDLSGSLQGAGGVGGLLSVTGWLVRGSTSAASLRYYYTFDGNGNVSEVINYNNFSAYSMCAHHEYDAFGNLTRIDSGNGGWSIAATNPFRFSTKWHDLINSQEEWGTLPLVHSLDPSKLYYYGYRFYAPEHGRWINRDPIEEEGGYNLYGIVDNDVASTFDILGLAGGQNNPPSYLDDLRDGIKDLIEAKRRCAQTEPTPAKAKEALRRWQKERGTRHSSLRKSGKAPKPPGGGGGAGGRGAGGAVGMVIGLILLNPQTAQAAEPPRSFDSIEGPFESACSCSYLKITYVPMYITYDDGVNVEWYPMDVREFTLMKAKYAVCPDDIEIWKNPNIPWSASLLE